MSMSLAGGESSDYQDMLNLIMSIDDPRMDAQDLAFFLVTHNYDAMPEGDHALLKLDGNVYRITPNGSKPGLADISKIK
ncbi:Uncharacterised protein [uncultured archaeon]|nr:Uncharacterised protein [uncultured archaeon]